jgi:uncharacterized protein YegJ (DUF2314 family)
MDNIKRFEADDVEMWKAVRSARDTFPQFLEAFVRPKPDQDAFLVKVAFGPVEQEEQIWLADLDLRKKPPTGVVANQPEVPGIEFRSRIEFEIGRITDWMYIDKGTLVGGYTTRLIRDRMTPEERAVYDATAPYRF